MAHPFKVGCTNESDVFVFYHVVVSTHTTLGVKLQRVSGDDGDLSYPRQSAVLLSQPFRHFRGETPITGAQEKVVIRH